LMSEMVLMGLSSFNKGNAEAAGPMRLSVLRGMAFFYFLAVDFSISFIPLRLRELIAFEGKEPSMVLLGLPVSVEMAAAGLAVLGAGVWAAKLPASRLLLAGLALAALGNLFSGLAFNPAGYILARALSGFGYGLGIISLQNIVVASSSPGMRGANIAVLFAGVYAGNVCGSSLGAMLADRVGFADVFILSAVVLGMLLCGVTAVFRRTGMTVGLAGQPGETPPRLSLRSTAHFLPDRKAGGLLLLLVFPASLIGVGMLNFLIPVSLSDVGVKQSDIGRIFMVYSLVFIFLAPLLSGKVARIKSKTAPMIFAGCLAGASLFFFALPESLAPMLWCAFGAVLCSSIALSISMSSQISFLLGQDISAKIGNAQAMSLYNTVERVGQMGGSMIFGSAMALLGIASFALLVGSVVIACAAFFYFLARESSCAHSHS
jgi:predicted MFS family arabinose efflux permease